MTSTERIQQCATCPQYQKCWTGNNERAIAVNLLVCRLRLGYGNVNATTRALLEFLRPKSRSLARWIAKATGGAFREALADVESQTVVLLMTEYEMGEHSWPLVWLYAKPHGAMFTWAMREIRKVQAHHSRYLLTEDAGIDIAGDIPDPPLPPLLGGKRAMLSLEDGLTVPLSEYRVLRFCMSNGLQRSHTYLADTTGLQRKALSRQYRNGCRRLIEAAGQTDEVLAKRGVVVHDVDRARRRRYLLGLSADSQQLARHEAAGLRALVDGGTAVTDACWAYGVSDKVYYAIKDGVG